MNDVTKLYANQPSNDVQRRFMNDAKTYHDAARIACVATSHPEVFPATAPAPAALLNRVMEELRTLNAKLDAQSTKLDAQSRGIHNIESQMKQQGKTLRELDIRSAKMHNRTVGDGTEPAYLIVKRLSDDENPPSLIYSMADLLALNLDQAMAVCHFYDSHFRTAGNRELGSCRVFIARSIGVHTHVVMDIPMDH
ncbi:hypothetical protein DACRYDRAFT_103903 [Dacryopinax primogenitus]|uniref:Uncharacterized protein n=1 Tax=Dacryopinax primogenitus (strain DJM 731) TaxID=1858805 RepID=M5GEG9_DACPD|nr:uncharacterized protein DACRYDRAFT_103903 [Dacryopinax primogenitus]EJU05417.1 hypothetical protein DACRYDRAFT_103903 [Dacryopinax primogenitus]